MKPLPGNWVLNTICPTAHNVLSTSSSVIIILLYKVITIIFLLYKVITMKHPQVMWDVYRHETDMAIKDFIGSTIYTPNPFCFQFNINYFILFIWSYCDD